MSEHPATVDSGAAGWIALTIAGERFALPMDAVEAVQSAPPLAPVPHAAPALLGVANFAGRVLPVVDPAFLLARRRTERVYDGSGAIVRLRAPSGTVGLWVDRVERLVRGMPGVSPSGHVAVLEATPLLNAALEPPVFAGAATAPLGDVGEEVVPVAVAPMTQSIILVEIAGRPFQLPRDTVVELIETVAWTRVPRAPPGLLGVGVLRGSAMPVLSLAALLALPEDRAPGSFAMIEVDRHRALLAVDRVIGLRHAAEAEPIDVGSMIPDGLRRIVLGFPTADEDAPGGASAGSGTAGEYLAFTAAGQDFALPIVDVDRVVAAPHLIALPRPASTEDVALSSIIGVIELAGQIVPVAGLQSRLARGGERERPDIGDPSAYVILRGPEGLGAIGVDRVRQVVTLRSDDIAPAAEDGLIEAVATPASGEVLRILSTARLWSAA